MTDTLAPTRVSARRQRVSRWPFLVAFALLTVAGAFSIWWAFNGQEPEAAPLPSAPFVASADQAPTGPTAAVVADQTITPETMAPNRLMIPSLGVYANMDVTRLENRELVINDDPTIVDRWDGSAPVVGTEGTVLLASHVAVNGTRGVLYTLGTITPGARAYMTDETGQVSEWQAESVQAVNKAELPDMVWSGPKGRRQAVIVTCGGPVITVIDASGRAHRIHRDNVYAVFRPAL